VPYIGYDMNSVLVQGGGHLQLQCPAASGSQSVISHGLQFTASYTYSHALDEQSGLGLFVTGNNPLVPRANYGSADFDQTHVF
jgi:hypothetical protein